ncbi:MAG: polyamine ABC transporter ATP-binding protein [Paludibacteraceae bacterium]|nr:polyamine ABC transporter ATP-binding protein [Paludibacteraceae bacterium]
MVQTHSDYIIEIQHVSKCFADGKYVLSDVSLNIRRGEFVTILGPSGCGKTTLLRCLGGFLQPTSGTITLNSQDLLSLPAHKRPINTVFQKYALFPHLNVYDNVAFGLKLRGVERQEINRQVKKALEMVGMTDYEWRDVNSLSGGQQQRVAFARAIINKPDVLLLDEPLAALDLKMRKDMQLELREMHRQLGITFIYVTHDQEEALTLSDRVVVMREGQIQQIGTPTDIYNEPQNCFVADFIGESNILDATMIKDELVHFCDVDFPCVDKGFGEMQAVDVVLRPEDIYIAEYQQDNKAHENLWQLKGEVKSCIFKGVHYEMAVLTDNGYELLVQDYHAFEAGTYVGLLIKPEDIQVMKKERTENTFLGEVLTDNQIRFLDTKWQVSAEQLTGLTVGDAIVVSFDFDAVVLEDDFAEGQLSGEVHFILYKGNYYHLTIRSESSEDIFVNTTDVWDDGDQVGIHLDTDKIRIKKQEI